jgi:hypothetical protein
MKLQIEPTKYEVTVDGVECRVWNGVTEDQKQVFVFIHRIASREDIQELLDRPNPKSILLTGENESEL